MCGRSLRLLGHCAFLAITHETQAVPPSVDRWQVRRDNLTSNVLKYRPAAGVPSPDEAAALNDQAGEQDGRWPIEAFVCHFASLARGSHSRNGQNSDRDTGAVSLIANGCAVALRQP